MEPRVCKRRTSPKHVLYCSSGPPHIHCSSSTPFSHSQQKLMSTKTKASGNSKLDLSRRYARHPLHIRGKRSPLIPSGHSGPSQMLLWQAGADQGRSCDYDVCEAGGSCGLRAPIPELMDFRTSFWGVGCHFSGKHTAWRPFLTFFDPSTQEVSRWYSDPFFRDHSVDRK